MYFLYHYFSRFVVLTCLLFCSLVTTAQNAGTFRINDYAVTFDKNISVWADEYHKSNKQNFSIVLLQFEHLLSDVDKQLLTEADIEILEFLGTKIYSARISHNSDLSKAKLITGITAYLPEFKIAPSVLEYSKSKRNLTIFVSFYSGMSSIQITEFLSRNSVDLLPDNWQKRGLYKIVIPSSRLISFASFYGVKYLSEPSGNIPLDLDSKGAEGASILNLPNTLGGKGLRGKDVVVGIGDNTSGIYHIDQSDRTINYNNGDKTSHGVFVHSITAGDGIMDLAGQGIATEGTCISMYFDAAILLKGEMYRGFNMTLTNNSYAAVVGNCAYSGTYDNISQNLDSLAFENKEQLDIFAVGNDGRLVCGGYPYGFHNVCGGFQTAKNIIAVGATSRDLVLGEGSSRGPLKDGRLKPEITAAGIDILGAIPDNTYVINRGTSFSSPQVTGVVALLSERYKQLNGGKNPKSDLLKAITLNGASDLGKPGPDFLYGFGFLNGVRSLDILEKGYYVRNTIAMGSTAQSYPITVPPNTAQLKVMLYYHDPMASASSSKQLVNDIDLTVTEPGGSAIHRPLVLDPTIAGVANIAVEGVDRLNNAEQVTINNPTAGTYTLTVSDFSIPQGPQDYVVVYDFVPNEIKLLFPYVNTAVAANTDMYIYWDAPADATATTKIEFSSNNGTSWSIIDAAIPAGQRYYKWTVPTVNSNQCKIRVSRGSMIDVSGSFVIHEKAVISLSSVQCPGSIAISWTNVPVADKYYLLLKRGAHFEKIDSVNAGVFNYTFKGLNTADDYYVSVLPSISAMEGYRSNAVTRRPVTGTCVGFADGDLAIAEIISPENGRRSTSLELKNNTPIKVIVHNQDNNGVANYNISYQVNGGLWKTIPAFSIAPNAIATVLVDTFDFSDTIEYDIKVAVKNLDRTDPISINDTMSKIVKHIPNNIIVLTTPVKNDFETLPDFTLHHDTVGLSKDGYWDYQNSNDTGRLRSRIPGSFLVTSNRSLSMDVTVNSKSNANFLTGTFNLSNYDTSIDEVRFDFEYEMRGMPTMRDSNKVWVRGSDLQTWIPVQVYSNVFDPVKLHNSGTLSLREIFLANHQNFSTSTQIRFGQYDTTVIVDDNYGGGVTIDNVNVYKVLKDVQLTKIITPLISECSIEESPVIVRIKNGTVNAVKGITIAYSLDSKTPVVENIPDSLLGADSMIYEFITGISSVSKGIHTLKVWLHVDGDDFLKNDTIDNYTFYNSPMITTFPYLQNFEFGEGDWYVNGRNPSWSYGTPFGQKIANAASGRNAWKTNLNGNHNSNEQSYLLSPCFSTIGLAKPMLSFSMAFELERCVAVCDRVYIEYSTDNEFSWTRLGKNGTGTNWYNNEVHNVWNGEETRWHVASTELPRASQLKLRFVMASDLGTNFEGFALDDIHIFDLKNKIVNLSDITTANSGLKDVTGTAWTYFTQAGGAICGVNAQGQNLGQSQADVYAHNQITDKAIKQYVMPRSFVLQKPLVPFSDASIRLFITDNDAKRIWDDTSCATCTKAKDIYRTGVTRYVDSNNLREDSSLLNNLSRGFTYFPFNKVNWVPYDNGYYAELATNSFGEFWFNDGGVLGSLPVNTEYVHLKARRWNDKQAELTWLSPIDTQMKTYQIQRSADSINFTEVVDVASKLNINNNYLHLDSPDPQENQRIYYRLFCTARNDKTFYSNIVSVQWTKGDQLLSVYPIPSGDGNLVIKWTGAVGSVAKYSLTDMTGKLILQNEIQSQSWLNENQLQLGFLSKGIYFLKIQIGSNQYQEKIIFK
ncbi:MAG: S8/S53 family peptidase [Bacteroidota bacterium]